MMEDKPADGTKVSPALTLASLASYFIFIAYYADTVEADDVVAIING